MDRLSHTLCGAWQAGAFLVISVSAWYLLKRQHEAFARQSIKVGLGLALVASFLQIVTGHESAIGVIKNQPPKMAAFEGHFESGEMPVYMFGWVDEQEQRVKGGIALPPVVSHMILGTNSVVPGLNTYPPGDRPPSKWVFQFYHGMVAIGIALFAAAVCGTLLCWRDRLFAHRWMLWILVFSVLGPQLANQLGWFAAEVGRQPWVVYGLLRTPEGLSAVVKANAVLSSLIMFTLIYMLLFAVFVYLLNDKIQHGPDSADLEPHGKLALPHRPHS
jgi:cytochrome d ubiquinol oxidase subunit I